MTLLVTFVEFLNLLQTEAQALVQAPKPLKYIVIIMVSSNFQISVTLNDITLKGHALMQIKADRATM